MNMLKFPVKIYILGTEGVAQWWNTCLACICNDVGLIPNTPHTHTHTHTDWMNWFKKKAQLYIAYKKSASPIKPHIN
jgi:hypothetical protein